MVLNSSSYDMRYVACLHDMINETNCCSHSIEMTPFGWHDFEVKKLKINYYSAIAVYKCIYDHMMENLSKLFVAY